MDIVSYYSKNRRVVVSANYFWSRDLLWRLERKDRRRCGHTDAIHERENRCRPSGESKGLVGMPFPSCTSAWDVLGVGGGLGGGGLRRTGGQVEKFSLLCWSLQAEKKHFSFFVDRFLQTFTPETLTMLPSSPIPQGHHTTSPSGDCFLAMLVS